jgi:2-amino-4-hydroxy-6-hydroxymethyldihydropteridine diphosphokinase
MNLLYLALGSNREGAWGNPCDTLLRARLELTLAGLQVVRSSRLYRTTPLGPGRQAIYLNAVLLIEANIAPGALLRLLKRIERRAGRRFGTRWGPRALDLDALDFGSRRLGWPARRRVGGRLVLPHPEIERRGFVLVPLLEVAPHWRHPALAIPGRTLLARLGRRARFGVRQSLDFKASACDKATQ